MVGRKYQSGTSTYRYSINGQEKSDELNENLTTALFWEYDSRIAKRWNVDPYTKDNESPYLSFSGNPIQYNDVLGDQSGNPQDPPKKKVDLSKVKATKDSYKNYSPLEYPSVFVRNSIRSAWNQGLSAIEDLPDNLHIIGNAFSKEGRAENKAWAFAGFIKAIAWFNSEPWKDVNTYEDIAGSFILGEGLSKSNPFSRGNSYINLVKKDGVSVVMAQTADDLAYLKSRGQQAGYMPSEEGKGKGFIMLSKKDRAQIIEEAIHYKQVKTHGADYAHVHQNQLEFEAQVELLKIGKAEGWSKSAISEIRNAMQYWGKRAIADLDRQIAENEAYLKKHK